MKRVERRKRKERIRFFYRNINSFLWKWTFLCQWKATLFWSVRQFRLSWIGKGFNPDYTQNCAGTCIRMDCWNYAGPCGTTNDCLMSNPNCTMGTCGCPAPVANSSQVLDSCTCQFVGNACTVCSLITNLCTTRYYTCPCGGICGYNCDAGYFWNGVACIPVATQMIELPKMGVGL